jgi:hypothetical protein
VSVIFKHETELGGGVSCLKREGNVQWEKCLVGETSGGKCPGLGYSTFSGSMTTNNLIWPIGGGTFHAQVILCAAAAALPVRVAMGITVHLRKVSRSHT